MEPCVGVAAREGSLSFGGGAIGSKWYLARFLSCLIEGIRCGTMSKHRCFGRAHECAYVDGTKARGAIFRKTKCFVLFNLVLKEYQIPSVCKLASF